MIWTSYKKNSWFYLQLSQNRKSAQAIVPPYFSNAKHPKGKGKLCTLCRRAQTRITFRRSQVQVTGLVIVNYAKHFLLNLKQIFWIVMSPRRHFWASSLSVTCRPAKCDTGFWQVGSRFLKKGNFVQFIVFCEKNYFMLYPLSDTQIMEAVVYHDGYHIPKLWVYVNHGVLGNKIWPVH